MDKLLDKQDFLLYIMGDCGSGKSHMCKYIIKCLMKQKRYDYVIVFSPTAQIGSKDGSYNFLPKELVHSTVDDNKLRNLMIFQKKNPNKRCLCIMDDCLGCFNKESKTFTNFCTTHRHLRTSVIFLSQYLKGLSPVCRANFSYLIISKPLSYEGLKKYKDIWFGDVDNLAKHFNHYCNRPYSFLFVNLYKNGKDKYKSIKAPPEKKEWKLEFN